MSRRLLRRQFTDLLRQQPDIAGASVLRNRDDKKLTSDVVFVSTRTDGERSYPVNGHDRIDDMPVISVRSWCGSQRTEDDAEERAEQMADAALAVVLETGDLDGFEGPGFTVIDVTPTSLTTDCGTKDGKPWAYVDQGFTVHLRIYREA